MLLSITNMRINLWRHLFTPASDRSPLSSPAFSTVLFILLCYCDPLTAGNEWQIESKMPLPLMGLHAATIEDGIYLLGGRHNGNVTTDDVAQAQPRMWRFDHGDNSWAELQPMPTARVFFDTAVIDNQMYAVGGAERAFEGEKGVPKVELYDPATNTWEQKTELPTARADLTVSAVNGRLYAIGGAKEVGLNALGTVEEYDPEANTWQRKAEMPTPRLHITSVVVDNKIYVIGGGPEWPVPTATVEIYDPATDSWAKGPDMPTERTGLWAAALDGKIYVTGGVGWDAEPVPTVEVLDTINGKWSTLSKLNVPRMLHATVAAASNIFVFGGSASDYTSLDSVEMLEPAR